MKQRFTKKLLLTIDPATDQDLRLLAAEQRQTLSGFIRLIVADQMAKRNTIAEGKAA